MSQTTKTVSEENQDQILIENNFVQRALIPYRTHCKYLKKVYFEQDVAKGVQGLVAKGTFSIPESCYIDDTGHFNAVEYNICYNQLGYVFLGHCVREGLIPELQAYDIETYFRKQLSNILITKIGSKYKTQLNAKHFYGTWGIDSIKKTSKCTFVNTYCNFRDDGNGKSEGEVSLAILHA